MNLLLVEPHELQDGRIDLDGPRAEHLLRVLRVEVGARVRAGVVDGGTGLAEVVAVEGARLTLSLETGPTPPRPRVDLILALPRPKVLGRLYAMLAQLGVDRVLLTHAAKVERFYFDAHQLAPEWRRVHLLEGLAQAKDTRLPRVTEHRSLTRLLTRELDPLVDRQAGPRLLAHPGGLRSVHAAASGQRPDARVLLAIGPEGGWTDDEHALFVTHGFEEVSLGARTLRTDTATIGLLCLVHDALGPALP